MGSLIAFAAVSGCIGGSGLTVVQRLGEAVAGLRSTAGAAVEQAETSRNHSAASGRCEGLRCGRGRRRRQARRCGRRCQGRDGVRRRRCGGDRLRRGRRRPRGGTPRPEPDREDRRRQVGAIERTTTARADARPAIASVLGVSPRRASGGTPPAQPIRRPANPAADPGVVRSASRVRSGRAGGHARTRRGVRSGGGRRPPQPTPPPSGASGAGDPHRRIDRPGRVWTMSQVRPGSQRRERNEMTRSMLIHLPGAAADAGSMLRGARGVPRSVARDRQGGGLLPGRRMFARPPRNA